MAEARSVPDVLRDIVRNIQNILRFEIHLARAELREEVRHAASAGAWIVAGTVGAVSAWMFLLWTLAYGLATRMPMWAATLVVSVVMATAAVALTMGGLRRGKRIHPIPERTVESVKESLEWMKHRAQ